MANLVYYKKEKEIFKTTFEKRMSIAEAEIVFGKLVKHFKIGNVQLSWTSGNRCPHFTWGWDFRVTLNRDWNSFGVLCHELAHAKAYKKYGENVGHSKKHFRIMKVMIAYCEKKNYFEEELKRRLTPKPIKKEPTKDELRMNLIFRLEKNCKRYEKKIQFFSNKLKKAQKKILNQKKFLE